MTTLTQNRYDYLFPEVQSQARQVGYVGNLDRFVQLANTESAATVQSALARAATMQRLFVIAAVVVVIWWWRKS